MTHLLPWLLCTTIVAAFPVRLTAAVVVSEDVSVPGGTAEFARAIGLDGVPDRGRFLSEISRQIYDNPEGRRQATETFLQNVRLRQARGRPLAPGDLDPRKSELVPAPLTAEIWGDAIFHRRVSRDELVMAIVADRTATLMCHGLLALDDDTLAYLAEHPAILTRLAERAAPAFGAFSSGLHIRGNRVVPPGGEAAAPLWESLTLDKVTRVDRFVAQLFELGEGRLAYLYDLTGLLDAPHRAFALGLWMPAAQARADRFKALATTGLGAFRDWHIRTQPFGRSAFDVGMLLTRVDVDEAGAPVVPGGRAFWARVFASADLSESATRMAGDVSDDPVDAAWLCETIGAGDVRSRGERLDQLAFAQRVFRSTPGADSAMLTALRALTHFRMLLLTLERVGVTSPSAYASAVRRAKRMSALEGRRGFQAQAQFQGSIALVSRMARARAIPLPKAQALIVRLVSLPAADDGQFAPSVLAAWLRDDVIAAVPIEDDLETTVLAAMSGPPSGGGQKVARVIWEGQPYRLDLGAAERQRLQRVRERQQSPSVDVVLDVAAAGAALAAPALTIDDAQAATIRLRRHAPNVPQRTRQEEEEDAPAGVVPPSGARDLLQKAIDDLAKAVAGKDVKHASRVSEPLLDLSNDLLTQLLLSLAYAAHVGDPDGTILLAGDVSHRHDFGFGLKDTDHRQRVTWAMPHQDVSPNVPWHVGGSLLGLDIALAPLALHRLNFERVLEAPRLTSNERDVFAASVSLMDPFALRDTDRDAIAAAIAGGRSRVLALAEGGLDAMADEIRLEPARRRALRWTLAHEPDRIASMVTLTELLVLGGGRPADFDAWGMASTVPGGCACSRLSFPGQWATLMGRPQLGLTASAVADLNLQVAIMLTDLRLPAALARSVLAGAMQDFLDDVRPTDDGDWLTMARAARTLSRERFEDHVAAATAGGPLMPDTGAPNPHP